MKTNKFMRIASFLLVAVVLTTCAISGTFAKYTSKVTGSDTARVALWKFNFGADDTQIGETVTFNLFDYTDNNNNVDVNGLADNAKVIAPGTTGSFDLVIENVSEVNAKYTIEFTETNANIPLQYSVDNTNWVDSIAELTMTDLTDVAINMGDNDTQTIYWRWVFEGTTTGAHAGQTDIGDTALGLGGTAEVTITANITVTQVD